MEKAANIKTGGRLTFLLALFMLTALNSTAQQSPLNKDISLHAPGISVKDALLLIGEETNMNFSYNSALIDNDKIVNLDAKNEKLVSVLDDIIGEDLQYKVVGNHIVLLAKNKENVTYKEIKKSGYSISGYIYDATNGKVIQSATIYDVDGERTSITDNEGFYSILIPSNDEFRGLTYCKEGYIDTVIIIKPTEDITLDMQLNRKIQPRKVEQVPEIKLAKSNFDNNRIVDAVIPQDALSHSNNLVLYERRIGQVSFLPFPGAHTSVNGVMINRFSLNILAGYTGGVEGIEVGGLINVDRNYVSGIQVAGFANVVGKKTRGLQVAGFSNINIGSILGLQVAGFNNVTNDTITGVQVAGFTNYLKGALYGAQVSGFYNHLAKGAVGVQAAGFVNYAGRDFRGAQLAGFANVAIDSIYGAQVSGFANYQRGSLSGAQVSGFANVSLGEVDGGQIAGFMNVSSGEVTGGQVAGFLNIAMGNINGGQVAGFSNVAVGADSGVQVSGFINIVANDYNGIQVAGFLNRAGNFKGLQVGLINSSNSSEGYSFGLYNGVKDGYKAFEISADEVLYANFTYKTGNNKLYNIYNVGIQPFSGAWGVGVGFGHYSIFSSRFHIFEEITSNAINENVVWESKLNLQNKFSLGLDYYFLDKFAFFIEGSFNIHLSGKDKLTNEYSTNIAFYPFYENQGTYVQTQMWLGGKAGLRIIL